MKKFKVVLAVYENGETNIEVMDLVNIENEQDRIMCAPDEFVVGETIDEDEFVTKRANYIDEDGNLGVGEFAYKVTSPYNNNWGVDGY